MKTLVESIAKALVDDPTQVNATEETEEDTLVISLTVAKDDMGRIIGKEGGPRRLSVLSLMRYQQKTTRRRSSRLLNK